MVGVQIATVDQVVRDLAALVEGPSPKGGDELVLIDQAILEGEQSKEEVAVRVDGGHGTDLLGVGRGRSVPDDGSHSSTRDPHRLDYPMADHHTHSRCARSGLASERHWLRETCSGFNGLNHRPPAACRLVRLHMVRYSQGPRFQQAFTGIVQQVLAVDRSGGCGTWP